MQRVVAELFHAAGEPVLGGVFGRGADHELHREQLLGDQLALFGLAIAKGDIEVLGAEIRRACRPAAGRLRFLGYSL